jgi:hypothetical protein
MANKLFAEVVIAGSYKNLSKSTRGASKELKGFEKVSKNIAGAVQAAFAGIAIAGIGMLADAIVDMTKAAQEDAKSMALLNKQMTQSWKATDTTKDAMEDYIGTVSRMTGIMDDDLRPAFGRIVRATKNSSQATSAFDNVLNIAADTGKDVNTVAQAYSKYLAGNKTALYRLIPGLKGAANEADYLKNTYAGMAELAGKNDPFARISVIMEDFKEKLGTAFLPLFNQFADWLASDEATEMLDRLAAGIQDVFKWFGSEEGQAKLQAFGDLILQIADYIADLIEAWDFFAGIYDTNIFEIPGVTQNDFNKSGSLPTSTTVAPSNINPPINITVNAPNVSGDAVVTALKNSAKTKGIPLSLLTR